MADDFTGADISAAMGGGSEPAPASDTGASAPATTTEPTAQPGAATTQPAATPNQPAKAAEPPQDKWPTILENARVKAIADYKAKYGWAENVDQARVREAVEIANRFNTDKVGYIRDLIDEANNDPQLREALRSEIGRRLAAGRSTAAPEPDIDVTDANGNVVERTFSSGQWAKREAWLKEQWKGEVLKELAPVVKSHKAIEQREHDAAVKAEADEWGNGFGAELKTFPHFEANKKEIGAEVVRIVQAYEEANPQAMENPAEYKAFLEAATLRAYHRVVTTRQDALSRQAAVHDLTTKASTSGVTPGRQPVGAPKPNTSGTFRGADIAEEFNRRKLGA